MMTPLASNPYKGGRTGWPPHVLNTENWPGVDPAGIPEGKRRTRFGVLHRTISDYVGGASLRNCLQACGLKERRFLELVGRCVSAHEDGRIQGFRALVYGAKVTKRRRRKPVKPNGSGGYAGAFEQLLREYPSILEGLVNWLLRRGRAAFRPNKTMLHNLHGEFIDLCVQAGITNKQYPLCTQYNGRRALWHWHKATFMRQYAARFIEAEYGKDAARLWNYAAEGDGEAARVYRPMQAWVMDGFIVDLGTKVHFTSKLLGLHDAGTQRLVGLRLADIVSGANLAHKVIFDAQVSANDVLEVICDALLGPGKLQAALKGVVLEEGAGFPCELVEELKLAVPVIIYLDNALAHLADDVEIALLGMLGCEIKFGEVRQPRERATIESKYRTQALNFLHQILGTTGSGPHDPLRKIAAISTSQLVDADVLAWALGAFVRNENCAPNAAAGYITPLDFLRRALRTGNCTPQVLPPHFRKRYFFCKPFKVRVFMDKKRGRPPEIHFKYAVYRSKTLNTRVDLWKKWLTVRYDVRSLRTVMLFNEDGTEFGPIQATGKWARFPHSMWFRQLYGRLKNKKVLGPRPETRPLHAVHDYLRDQATRDARAALQLAGVHQMLLAAGGPALEQVDEDMAVAFAEWEAIQKSAESIQLAPVVMPSAKKAANDPKGVTRRAARAEQAANAAGNAAAPSTTKAQPFTPPPGWANKPTRIGAWKPIRR